MLKSTHFLMQFGKNISITPFSVQAVLDSLVFANSLKHDTAPLLYLFVVEQALLNPATPQSNSSRLYIIQNILTKIIAQELKTIRDKFAVPYDFDETLESALNSITLDARMQSDHLIAWSVLYYHYVQVDLNLSIDDMATAIGVADRTLRRYRNHGIELLTQKLWEEESNSRKELRYKRILIQLQPFQPDNYVGNQQHLERVLQAVVDRGVKHFNVHGTRGIGKSRFVKRCILQLVEVDFIDDVLWISDCESISILEKQVRHHFLSDDHRTPLHDFFTIFNCAVVFDDFDRMLNISNWMKIDRFLAGAIVFTTNTKSRILSQSFVNIRLQALTYEESYQLVKSISNDKMPYLSINQVVKSSNGNPSNLIRLYSLFLNPESPNSPNLSLRQIILLILIPDQGVLESDFDRACKILSISVYESNLVKQFGEVTAIYNRLYRNINLNDLEVVFEDLFAEFELFDQLLGALDEAWDIVLHLLVTYGAYIHSENRILLIEQHWHNGITYGDKIAWYAILLQLSQENDALWIQLAIAVAQRAMAEFDQAKSKLNSIVNLSGVIGDFGIQAQATIELVKLHRLLGQYRLSLQHLNRLTSVLQKFLNTEQFHELQLEQIQLAIDSNRLGYALTVIESFPLTSSHALLLKAEILYRLNKYDKCAEACRLLLDNLYLPALTKGVAHNLLGRCQQVNMLYEEAFEHFSIAIEYFRPTFNLIHLCRARVNLATTCINLEQYDKAIAELNTAKELADITSDVVAQKSIDKNRKYVWLVITSAQ